MKVLFALTVLIAVAYASSVEEQWQQFKQTHSKTYKSLLEEKRRFTIFKDNLREIEEHNVRYSKGEFTYTLGVNQFSDMTQAEFEATLSPMEPNDDENVSYLQFNETGLVGDENINWVTKGYVTPVRNQGSCGSCWAFSAAGAIEALFKKNGDDLVVLSPQNLLDCARSGGILGCRGGYMTSAFDHVKSHGILEDSKCAYVGKQQACEKEEGKKIKGYVKLDGKPEDTLLKALTQYGPISVAIDSRRIKGYSSGIVGPNSGCTTRVDHAVLLVGAGTENGQKYWLIKNSWGTKWGVEGYLKLARGKNACGITRMNSVPTM